MCTRCGSKRIRTARKLYQQVRKSGLFDQKLKMYCVNADLSGESEEIGRARVFPAGWLENASIWLHMEYKFMLELLRSGLYEEFFENFRNVLIPFLKPTQYGRSILENSSFLVSSMHEDSALHGQGFVARLSGSTAEFLHMWLYMNLGANPFTLDPKNELRLEFKPVLPGWLFSKKTSAITYVNASQEFEKFNCPPTVMPSSSWGAFWLFIIILSVMTLIKQKSRQSISRTRICRNP